MVYLTPRPTVPAPAHSILLLQLGLAAAWDTEEQVDYGKWRQNAGQVQQPRGLTGVGDGEVGTVGRDGRDGTWTACAERGQIGGLSGFLGSTKSLQS